jgi:hypothetical protein
MRQDDLDRRRDGDRQDEAEDAEKDGARETSPAYRDVLVVTLRSEWRLRYDRSDGTVTSSN